MPTNRFKELVNTTKLEHKTDQALKDAITKDRLVSSTKFRGSSTSLLFNDDEAALLSEFVDHMRKNRFPVSESISLKAKRTRRALTLAEQLSNPWSKIKKLVKSPTWLTLWKGQGYLIGVFMSKEIPSPNFSNCCMVYVCDDGMLRCRRSQPLYLVGQSRAKGFGSIPDINSNSSIVFKTGVFMQDNTFDLRSFKSKELEVILKDYALSSFSK